MSKSLDTAEGKQDGKKPVGALFLKVMTSLVAKASPSSTLMVKKNRFAGGTRRGGGGTRMRGIGGSSDYLSESSQEEEGKEGREGRDKGRRPNSSTSPLRQSRTRDRSQDRAQDRGQERGPNELPSLLKVQVGDDISSKKKGRSPRRMSSSRIQVAFQDEEDDCEPISQRVALQSLGGEEGVRRKKNNYVENGYSNISPFPSPNPSSATTRMSSRNNSNYASPARSRQPSIKDDPSSSLRASNSSTNLSLSSLSAVSSPVISNRRSFPMSSSTDTVDSMRFSQCRGDDEDGTSRGFRSTLLSPISPTSWDDGDAREVSQGREREGKVQEDIGAALTHALKGLSDMRRVSRGLVLPSAGSNGGGHGGHSQGHLGASSPTMTDHLARPPSQRRMSSSRTAQLSLLKGSQLGGVLGGKIADSEARHEEEMRRFWSKVVKIVCVKRHVLDAVLHSIAVKRELRRRTNAAWCLLNALLRFRCRRYTALQREMMKKHRHAIRLLREFVIAWHYRRATVRIKDFLVVCSRCKAHPHGISTQYLMRYIHAVRLVQAAVRDFLRRKGILVRALERTWDAFELQYLNNTVKSTRTPLHPLHALHPPVKGVSGKTALTISTSSCNSITRDFNSSRDFGSRDFGSRDFNGHGMRMVTSTSNGGTSNAINQSTRTHRRGMETVPPLAFFPPHSSHSSPTNASAPSSSHPSHSSSHSSLTAPLFFGPAPHSPASAASGGSEGDKRSAYFKNMEMALEHRRANIDMAHKRHGRAFDATHYLLPKETRAKHLMELIRHAREELSGKYKESLRLQYEWTAERTEYSTADALSLVQGDSQDSLLSLVRYKMEQGASKVGDARFMLNQKKRLPFVFYKLHVYDVDVHRRVREAHEKNLTFEAIEKQCVV